ncbi:MAG: translation elongation factor G [candidate division NC10 bacterium RIFCSPLOWO2_12_FULL_66_18]|nr:MAG: translation elongation factor G [candidate division NC10 bacterium RIFCSPLOWO2_02_FULL_66_22]OGC02074.1 MAG: translation elongation factor G [candidate division NC10 bacterium RIFCSPLOWO2_12_FULL_66_18]
MKRPETAKIRNVALVAHGGAGKTTLTEALLFCAGATTRLGRVEDGTTTTDFDEDEIRRKISISAAMAWCEWKGRKVNLVDTPGFAAFLTDAKNALRVVDGAVVVVGAPDGVKVQTEKVWSTAAAQDLPRVIYLSKMDRERADFSRALEDVQKNLSPKAVPVQVPIGQEAGFTGVVDLVRMRAFTFATDGSGKATEGSVPEAVKALAEKQRAALVEAVAEADDRLLEKYLETGELTEAEVQEGLAKGIRDEKLFPVLCGAPSRNVAVAPLLDLLAECFPSPTERPVVEGTDPKGNGTVRREVKDDAPLAALVFKTVADPYAGKVTMFRVYSGTLTSDSSVLNATKGVKERVGQLLLLRGKQQTPVESVGAGDMGAVVKLKETGTGDTLCDEKAPIRLPEITFPAPVISFAVEPKAKGDEDKMSTAFTRLREEDPTIQIRYDPQTRETVVSGMGRAHVEIVGERLKRKFGVEVTLKTPRVPYKETIKAKAREIQGRHKKQTGGRGQFGDCWIHMEPVPRSGGFEFVNQVVGGAIPRNYIPAVEKGILEGMERGPVAGYPVVDLRVILYDGSTHAVDSSELAFKLAGRLAFRKAMTQAKPTLLEPIMTVEVIAPGECMGDIVGDLNSKRGRVLGIEAKGRNQAVKANVPLSEMLEYDSRLRSITGDRGDYSMEFSHYEEVPAHLQEKIVAEAKRPVEEEEE